MARSQHWRAAPDLKGLYGEARVLRDIVIGRLAAIGCEIEEKSLPEAQAILVLGRGDQLANIGADDATIASSPTWWAAGRSTSPPASGPMTPAWPCASLTPSSSAAVSNRAT
jgi:hypothetical protein